MLGVQASDEERVSFLDPFALCAGQALAASHVVRVAVDVDNPFERPFLDVLLAVRVDLFEQYTTSAMASIIYSLNPILTAGLATALIPDEHFSRGDIVGIVLGMIGVVVLVQPTSTTFHEGGLYGQGLLLFGAIALSLGSVLMQRAEASLPILSVSAWGMLIGGLITHGAGFALGESSADIQLTTIALAALVFEIVFVSVIAYTWWFDLVRKIGST